MTTKSTQYFEHLELAKLPAGNPASLEELISCDRYVITPIEHDYAGKTAAMWNAAYQHLHMNIRMAMMVGETQFAKEIINNFREDPKYLGGGSGVGFKDENVKYVDELDPLASAIGSINLIQKLPSGKLKGWNTDGIGYRQALEELLGEKGITLSNAKIVILGAGGTGNAVALALAEKGAEVVILNRTLEKAEELARRINTFVGRVSARGGGEDTLKNEIKDASVVINVSTKGATGAFEEYSALAPARLPATPENISENRKASEDILASIPRGVILSDVVLRATPSPFMEQAQARGFATLDGIPMVINQGVEAFLIVHGGELGTTNELRSQLKKIMQDAANFKN